MIKIELPVYFDERDVWFGIGYDKQKSPALVIMIHLACFAEFSGSGSKTQNGCVVTQIETRRKENVSTAREVARVS